VVSVDDRKKILMDNAIGLYKLAVDKSQINQSLYQPGSITVGPRPEAAKPASGASV
jgi:hypothetical protein